MNHQPYTYCSYCGTPFAENAPWPRSCRSCGSTTFRNPLPVCVVLVPIRSNGGSPGVLAVRRAIPPRLGELALPGGYINYGETWQEAGAREVLEETGLMLDPAEIQEFCVRSAPDHTLIIFARSDPRQPEDLPPFAPNEEASDRVILYQPIPLAFGLHTEIVRLFFADQQG